MSLCHEKNKVIKELKRLKELESEHARLKRMYADLSMENNAIKELLEKKF